MLAAEQFRLIPAPAAPGDSVSRFIGLADQIMCQERFRLVRALQAAVDRHPEQFAEYLAAFRR